MAPCVNFINILRARFLYEFLLKPKSNKKNCQNDFSYEKFALKNVDEIDTLQQWRVKSNGVATTPVFLYK